MHIHVFFGILQLIYKEIRTDGFQNRTKTETELNLHFFSKPNRNQTELEKSIPHIPSLNPNPNL